MPRLNEFDKLKKFLNIKSIRIERKENDYYKLFTLRQWYTVNNSDNLWTSANILISSVHMVSVINENNKLLVQLHKGHYIKVVVIWSCCNLGGYNSNK